MGRKLNFYNTALTLAAVAQRPLLFAAIYRLGPWPSQTVGPLASTATTCVADTDTGHHSVRYSCRRTSFVLTSAMLAACPGRSMHADGCSVTVMMDDKILCQINHADDVILMCG